MVIQFTEILDSYKRFLTDKLEESGCKGYVVNLSGGIDSAVVSALIKMCEIPVRCVLLPCESTEDSLIHALRHVKEFEIPYDIYDLKSTFIELTNLISNDNKMINGNIKARLRMISGMAVAYKYKYLLAGTCNIDEIFIGYETKFGDGACDVQVLDIFHKSAVRKLAEYLNIDNDIINKKPSADLWDGQTDESELGFDWITVENYMKNDMTNIPGNILEKIYMMHKNSTHKRELAQSILDTEFEILNKKSKYLNIDTTTGYISSEDLSI